MKNVFRCVFFLESLNVLNSLNVMIMRMCIIALCYMACRNMLEKFLSAFYTSVQCTICMLINIMCEKKMLLKLYRVGFQSVRHLSCIMRKPMFR